MLNKIINSLPLTRLKIGIAKFLYSFIKVFVRKNDQIIVRNGIKFSVDLSEGLDLSLYLFGNFQSHVSKNKYLTKLPDNAVIFDIGANVGMMALQFARLVPKGTVYAFEPTHFAADKLKTNLSLNPELSGRVKVVQTFISAESSSNPDIKAFSSWKVGGHENEDHKHPVHLGTAKSTEGVGSVSLNQFCSENNIPRLDFIKIDTDGHEFEIFKGGKETIKKFRPVIIFEIGIYVMDEKGIDFNFYADFFKESAYKMFDSNTGKTITAENYRSLIPSRGTIDILAVPEEKL